jgi:hypothetical protein
MTGKIFKFYVYKILCGVRNIQPDTFQMFSKRQKKASSLAKCLSSWWSQSKIYQCITLDNVLEKKWK